MDQTISEKSTLVIRCHPSKPHLSTIRMYQCLSLLQRTFWASLAWSGSSERLKRSIALTKGKQFRERALIWFGQASQINFMRKMATSKRGNRFQLGVSACKESGRPCQPVLQFRSPTLTCIIEKLRTIIPPSSRGPLRRQSTASHTTLYLTFLTHTIRPCGVGSRLAGAITSTTAPSAGFCECQIDFIRSRGCWG